MTITNSKVAGIIAVLGLLILTACAGTKAPVAKPTTATSTKASDGVTQADASSQDYNSYSVVYFDFDRASISPNEAKKLDLQVEWLKQKPNATKQITVEGHTDYLGTREYNLALGERRASAVKDYLRGKGIAANRINVTSYGKDMPIDNDKTDEARMKNRRAVSVR